jgi:hypothetical protein
MKPSSIPYKGKTPVFTVYRHGGATVIHATNNAADYARKERAETPLELAARGYVIQTSIYFAEHSILALRPFE